MRGESRIPCVRHRSLTRFSPDVVTKGADVASPLHLDAERQSRSARTSTRTSGEVVVDPRARVGVLAADEQPEQRDLVVGQLGGRRTPGSCVGRRSAGADGDLPERQPAGRGQERVRAGRADTASTPGAHAVHGLHAVVNRHERRDVVEPPVVVDREHRDLGPRGAEAVHLRRGAQVTLDRVHDRRVPGDALPRAGPCRDHHEVRRLQSEQEAVEVDVAGLDAGDLAVAAVERLELVQRVLRARRTLWSSCRRRAAPRPRTPAPRRGRASRRPRPSRRSPSPRSRRRRVVARRPLCVDLGEHHVVDVPVDVHLDLELRLEGLGEGSEVCRRLDAVEIDRPLLLRPADQCAPACRGQGRGRRCGRRLRDAAGRRGGCGECGQDSQCCHDEDDRSEVRPEPNLGQRILLSTARSRV